MEMNIILRDAAKRPLLWMRAGDVKRLAGKLL
jgi:hypothetical protein